MTTTHEETVDNLKEVATASKCKSLSSANNHIHLQENTEPP